MEVILVYCQALVSRKFGIAKACIVFAKAMAVVEIDIVSTNSTFVPVERLRARKTLDWRMFERHFSTGLFFYS